MILWHEKLGHASGEVMINTMKKYMCLKDELLDSNFLMGISKSCDACLRGKMKKLPHPKLSSNRSSTPGETSHYDTLGQSRVASLSGARYAGVLVDECAMYSYVRFARQKNEFLGNLYQLFVF